MSRLTSRSVKPSVDARASPSGRLARAVVAIAAMAGSWGGASCGNAPVMDVTSPVASVALSQQSLSMRVSETAQLTVTLLDADGAVVVRASVHWESSNRAIATVSSSGVILAVTPGVA